MDISGFDQDRHGRIYLLSQFNISPASISAEKIRSGRSWLFGKNRKKLTEEKVDIECPHSNHIHDSPLYKVSSNIVQGRVPTNLILEGYWQSASYFQDCEDLIREHFTLIETIPNCKRKELASLDVNNAVCVGIRRYKEEGNKPSHLVLSPEYYESAFAYILTKIKKPTFVVVCSTEDQKWAKEHISFPGKTFWPTHQSLNEDAYMNLWLMSQFSFFVLANSTYHWWGGWLSQFRKKIVISPANGWTNSNPHIENSYII